MLIPPTRPYLALILRKSTTQRSPLNQGSSLMIQAPATEPKYPNCRLLPNTEDPSRRPLRSRIYLSAQRKLITANPPIYLLGVELYKVWLITLALEGLSSS